MATKKSEEAIIRKLKATEIECRVGTINDKGCSLLLYKDARVDMRILDEHFGPMNWKRDHEVVNGNLFCTISVWDKEKGEWVSKQDVGVESNTEKEKGQASDAFKRAGFNWGIGRELYSAPFIWIRLDQNEIVRNEKTGRLSTRTKFSVAEIGYNEDGEIDKLAIIDENLSVRYTLGSTKMKKSPRPAAKQTTTANNAVKEAVAELNACKSREELNKVWSSHVDMQNNTEFVNTCMSVAKKFPKK